MNVKKKGILTLGPSAEQSIKCLIIMQGSIRHSIVLIDLVVKLSMSPNKYALAKFPPNRNTFNDKLTSYCKQFFANSNFLLREVIPKCITHLNNSIENSSNHEYGPYIIAKSTVPKKLQYIRRSRLGRWRELHLQSGVSIKKSAGLQCVYINMSGCH